MGGWTTCPNATQETGSKREKQAEELVTEALGPLPGARAQGGDAEGTESHTYGPISHLFVNTESNTET